MEEEELNIDPAAICRCCLAEHDALRAIFSKEIINGSIVSFRSVFECVVGFQVGIYTLKLESIQIQLL